MAALDDPRAAERLRSMLHDPEAEVRDAAFTAMVRLHQADPLAAAESGLNASHEDVRRRGLQALVDQIRKAPAAGAAEPALALLARALNDSFPAVRSEAFKSALGLQVGGGRRGHAPVRLAERPRGRPPRGAHRGDGPGRRALGLGPPAGVLQRPRPGTPRRGVRVRPQEDQGARVPRGGAGLALSRPPQAVRGRAGQEAHGRGAGAPGPGDRRRGPRGPPRGDGVAGRRRRPAGAGGGDRGTRIRTSASGPPRRSPGTGTPGPWSRSSRWRRPPSRPRRSVGTTGSSWPSRPSTGSASWAIPRR